MKCPFLLGPIIPFTALNTLNMRFSNLFLLLLAGIILGWAGCDDEDGLDGCLFTLPTLDYSDGSCEPNLFIFDNLLGTPTNDGVLLTPSCLNANEHGQVIELAVPLSADNDAILHVYNATYGYAYVELFGSTDCGVTGTSLTGCISTTDVASAIPVSGLSGFDNYFIRIDVAESGPSEPFEEYIPEGDQFIAVAVYDEAPEPGGEVSYRGYNPESQLDRLDISCNGGSTQRVILGSCSPNADVDSWRQEVGLPLSESYSGNGGIITAADVPPGLDPNTTGTALTKRRPKQNTDDYFAEEDFIIRVPVPNGPGLLDAQDFAPNLNDLLECLIFEPGLRSTEKRDDQLVVTMIDGGVDVTGEREGFFYRHLNLSIDQPYAEFSQLGHDFIRGGNFPNDEFGHGTATSGALVGNYDGDRPLTVIHNKIFGFDPVEGVFGTYFGTVVAVQVAGNINSDVINMSLGLSPDEEPQALRCAIAYAVSQGATIVASAGNDMENIDAVPQWPAAFSSSFFPQVVAVASYNYLPGGFADGEDPVRSEFSNFGPGIVNVAAYLTAKTPRFEGTGSDDFNYLAGTSISAPLISSALASEITSGGNAESLLASFPSSSLMMAEVMNGWFLPVCE